ncbi:MAG: hypothetical protein EZS28_046752 [Streblomastix strix]|uniref:Tyr recombinase domain-containing protein n=1 Tax=Streblomastix strix TaxID=222440 RepID=A0A5J4TJM6_9EUKA|nr:MAG: hypothetical protein EZS28_046752 [Streblomastix strix]
MRRLRNQEKSPLEDAQGAWDLDLYRHICNTREPTMNKVLQYLQRQVCCQAKWIQSRMGLGNSVTSPTNLLTTEDYKEDQERASPIRSLDSARLDKLEVVHRTERDYKTEDMLSREYASLTNGSETQKQRMGAATWIDLSFFSGSKNGEKLFRQLLQARGLSSKAVDRVISNWLSQRRTHIAGLTLLAGYLKRISQHPEYLLNLEQPQIFMTNYLEDAINQKCSDNSVKNQRCALAILLKFMGYPEKQIHSELVKQHMRKIRMRLRQTDKEKQIWNLDILLNYIKQQVPLLEQNLLSIEQRRAIAATLVMVFTVARLAELHRAVLLSTSEDEQIIQTTILKSPQRIAEFKICKIPEERICSLHWFKSWFSD